MRTPPKSIESERAIIGCVLLNEKASHYIVKNLQTQDFYIPKHALIFDCVKDIVLSGNAVDLVSVKAELDKRNQYNDSEDIKELSKMTDIVPSIKNLPNYVKTVKEKAQLRNLATIANETLNDIYDPDLKPTDVINETSQKILNMSLKNGSSFRHIKDVLVDSYMIMAEQSKNKGNVTGLRTGFKTLDYTLNGLQKSQLVILAGLSGQGKTAFALNIIQNVALEEKGIVAVFSLEMGDNELGTRLLCSGGSVNSSFARIGKIDAREFERLAEAQDKLSQTHVYIDDGVSVTPSDMLAKCRYLKVTKGLDLIVIDYLQLMRASKQSGNTVEMLSEITRDLKIMAKMLQVPILCLSQLSREAAKLEKNHSPKLAHLRGSGSIEQDADVVLFLHRPNYDADNPVDEEDVQIKVAKQRSGITRKIDMVWYSIYTRFEEKL